MSNRALDHEMDDLAKRIDVVRDILRQLVDAREILFREVLRDDINNAWTDVLAAIDGVQLTLKSYDSTVAEKLGDVGLAGPQLKLKLHAFDLAINRFKTRGTLKLMLKVLDWINDLLQSILSAIPGGEAIKEFKDALENELSDDSET